MMRWDSFGRSLLFAALAAAGLLLAAQLPLPPRALLMLYPVVCVVAYLAGIAPTPRRALRAGLAGGLLGGLLLLLAAGPLQAALGAALLLAVGRSLLRGRGRSGLVLEVALTGGGLLLAAGLFDGSLGSLAAALWGFFLVQSLGFVVGGFGADRQPRAEMDAFEQASQRLTRLLERDERPGR